jgi:hypothetical protein
LPPVENNPSRNGRLKRLMLKLSRIIGMMRREKLNRLYIKMKVRRQASASAPILNFQRLHV